MQNQYILFRNYCGAQSPRKTVPRSVFQYIVVIIPSFFPRRIITRYYFFSYWRAYNLKGTLKKNPNPYAAQLCGGETFWEKRIFFLLCNVLTFQRPDLLRRAGIYVIILYVYLPGVPVGLSVGTRAPQIKSLQGFIHFRGARRSTSREIRCGRREGVR